MAATLIRAGPTEAHGMVAGQAAQVGGQVGGRVGAVPAKVTCGAAAAACAQAAGCGVVHCDGTIEDEKVEIFNYKQGGEYQAVIEYRYVGEGAGDFTKIEVVSNVSGNWSCWGFFGCFGIIIACCVIWFGISPETTTTTMPFPTSTFTIPPSPESTTTFPPPPPQSKKECTIFGDPHVLTFDSAKADHYQAGIFTLVKAPLLPGGAVDIQALFAPTHATNGLSVTKGIAVGGAFLPTTLRIGVEHAFYGAQPILTTFPGAFKCPGGECIITYDSIGPILQAGREGKNKRIVHVHFTNGIGIQVNRWNQPNEGRYMNVRIRMPRTPTMGICGNFNGNAIDDHRRAVFGQIGSGGVTAAESLFPGTPPVVDTALAACPDATLLQAHEACKAVSGEFWPHKECLEAVCKGSTAQAWKAGAGAIVA